MDALGATLLSGLQVLWGLVLVAVLFLAAVISLGWLGNTICEDINHEARLRANQDTQQRRGPLDPKKPAEKEEPR